MKMILISMFFTLLTLTGCPDEPEQHRIMPSGNEYGVELEVLLKNGGTAKLVCPKFKNKPSGGHGRECYLREYHYDLL